MTRNVLVTGGFGYLGGRICRHLHATGKRRIRLTTRRNADSRPTWGDAFDVRELDLEGPSENHLLNLCDGIDDIIHLAAMNAAECAADPQRARRINVEGTAALYRAAATAGVSRFLYLSTLHVYGSNLSGRIDERVSPRPIHPYGETHLAAETAVLGGDQPTGIVLRLSNAVGCPADAAADCWMLAAPDFCRQAARGGPIRLAGDGTSRRNFVCMEDVVRGTEHLLDLPTEQLGDGLFNLGGADTVEIYGLAKKIADLAHREFGEKPDIRRSRPAIGSDPSAFTCSCEKLETSGFSWTGDLDRELRETLVFCRRTDFPEQSTQ